MQFIENIQYTFHKLCDTIVKIRDNLNYYLDLLQKQSTTRAIGTCKTQLMRIAKSLSVFTTPLKLLSAIINLHSYASLYLLDKLFYIFMTGKMSPSAVLVIKNGQVRLVNIKNQDTINKIIDMVPDLIDRFTSKRL